jgi:hypothetical protein
MLFVLVSKVKGIAKKLEKPYKENYLQAFEFMIKTIY